MASSAVRRSTRDWLVDITLFVVAVLFGLFLSHARLTSWNMPEPAWLFDLDQFVGILGCVALWLRRRSPVELAVVLTVASAFSELVTGAAAIAQFTVAVHRPPRVTAGIFVLGLVAAAGFGLLRPEPDLPMWFVLLFSLAVQCALFGWGLVIRHRRELVLSLRERAVRAEAEAELRAERTRSQAREEIAREMHDVLGHRLSLLSVHAGALEFRPDAPAEDIARAAAVIRESSHRALQDLREVIGVLRAPVGELPQPVFADVSRLVAESARAGMAVRLRSSVAGPVPDLAGRTAYRVVQEGMTNARKHAPASDVDVALSGAPGEGLTVEVTNTASAPARDVPPGLGLVGLAERVSLAGGTFEYGPTPEGGWRVRAWLPWPP